MLTLIGVKSDILLHSFAMDQNVIFDMDCICTAFHEFPDLLLDFTTCRTCPHNHAVVLEDSSRSMEIVGYSIWPETFRCLVQLSFDYAVFWV